MNCAAHTDGVASPLVPMTKPPSGSRTCGRSLPQSATNKYPLSSTATPTDR